MEDKQSRRFLLSIILFLVLFGITAYILANGIQLDVLYEELFNINVLYLSIAIICALMFIICESMNIRRILNSIEYRVSLVQGLKYGAIGFFFSGLTPSATGGQPMQLYSMCKDKIKLSHSSMTLVIEFASLQMISTSLGFMGFLMNFQKIIGSGNYFGWIIVIGLIVNVIILLFLLGLIFLPKIMNTLVNKFCNFLVKFKFFRKRIDSKKIEIYLSEYHDSIKFMKQNPSIFLKTILTTIVQMLAFYSVIYFVCLALGLNNVSWIGLLSLQAVFSVGLSFLPVPGVVGLTEYGFLTVFSSLFTGDILTTVLVISRTLSFYFLLIVSGLYVGLTFLINKRSL